MAKSVFPSSQSGDIYAIGCLFYEIFYRLPLISADEAVKHPSGPPSNRRSVLQNSLTTCSPASQ